MTVLTYRQRVAEYFHSRPGQWVDGMTLADLGGQYAWRSRVSDVRRELGMVIENRQRRVGRRVVSEYRYLPRVEPSQVDLFHGDGVGR